MSSGGEGPEQSVSRRQVLGGMSLLGLAAMVPELTSPTVAGATAKRPSYRFFTRHQAAVVDAAVRRIAPGPDDDPLEAGHPGAHEAGVVHYLDILLSVFDDDPPRLFTGGPWSNRHTHGVDHMKHFVRPDPAQAHAWRERVSQLRHTYRAGVKLLDEQAGGDFTSAATSQQDQILASGAVAEFTAVLFGHTIEGMYSVPEYGGNRGLVGWEDIKFPGDSQPRGYTAAELAEVEIDPADPSGVIGLVLDNFEQVAHIMAAGRRRA